MTHHVITTPPHTHKPRSTLCVCPQVVSLFGDLESAWFKEETKADFLRLPLPALQFLFARTETAVVHENTVLVAMCGWLAAQPPAPAAADAIVASSTVVAATAAAAAAVAAAAAAPAATAAAALATARTAVKAAVAAATAEGESMQALTGPRDALFALLRIPFLSSAFLSILLEVDWVRTRASPAMLLRAFQLSRSDERTQAVLATALGLFAVPRSVPERCALELDWTVSVADISVSATAGQVAPQSLCNAKGGLVVVLCTSGRGCGFGCDRPGKSTRDCV